MIAFPSPVLAAGIMDLNPGLTLWTAITFLALILFLAKFAFGPIVRMLDERERTIHEAIDQAKRERAEAERMLADQTAALSAAQREAAELAQRSRKDVEALRAELTNRARKEADELIATSRRQIQEEKLKALAELKGQVVDLAIDAARRLIESSLDERSQRALVEEYIATLPTDRAA
ncbi:MAG TPA: F0F1 ATP synthase subunit B [Anaeromyxobacteraceae bacterium]|nr:F0F1 ATP synthase subunit B [Anaeromyxobacteraceae bacterium]